jgi:hypothetical protein
MILYVVILREAEALGVAKLAQAFNDKQKAFDFAKKVVTHYTTDIEQLNFISDRIGDPIEFVSDDQNYWQIEICEAVLEENMRE